MSEIGHNGGPALRDGNWIAISRDMIDHHIVGAGQVVTPADRNRGAFSRLESWLDLLMLANFAERRISAKGVTTILGPGQTIAGRAFSPGDGTGQRKPCADGLIVCKRN
ncbi:MAG: hypothetical protein IPK78_19905 [Rhodospirillales bacterium]|nr:hypothetical protein [Rhodospirillales bacterium]